MKATEQYFPVVLFIMLYKIVPSLESVDDILKCDPVQDTNLFSTFLCAFNHDVEGDSAF